MEKFDDKQVWDDNFNNSQLILKQNSNTQINHDNKDILKPYLGWFKR